MPMVVRGLRPTAAVFLHVKRISNTSPLMLPPASARARSAPSEPFFSKSDNVLQFYNLAYMYVVRHDSDKKSRLRYRM
jgi:hypothetical protein